MSVRPSMYKETVSLWFMFGSYLHSPESGFFLFDEMKEGAPQSSYDDFWDTPFVFLEDSGSGTNLLTHKQGIGDAKADHCRRDQTGELRPDQQKALPQRQGT